jgi:hypothetical protein
MEMENTSTALQTTYPSLASNLCLQSRKNEQLHSDLLLSLAQTARVFLAIKQIRTGSIKRKHSTSLVEKPCDAMA